MLCLPLFSHGGEKQTHPSASIVDLATYKEPTKYQDQYFQPAMGILRFFSDRKKHKHWKQTGKIRL